MRTPTFRSRTRRRIDGRLLRVLLAEVRALGLDDVEELEADGRDGAEVTGASGAFGTRVLDVDPGTEAGGIDLGRARCEQDVDAFLLCDLGIARLVARIRGEVGCVAELGGVDEEGRDDELVLAARRAEERAMAVMQGAHRRHEPDRAGELELRDRPHDLHVASATVAPARVS